MSARKRRQGRLLPADFEAQAEEAWQEYAERLSDPEYRHQVALEEARDEVERKWKTRVWVAIFLAIVLTIVALVAWHSQTQAHMNACYAVNGQWINGHCYR